MQTVTGYLVQVVQGNGLYMLAVATRERDNGLLMLPMTAEDYHGMFPAGDPALNDPYEIKFEQNGDEIRLESIFNLTSEVIPANLVPTLVATEDMEVKGQKFMDMKANEAALAKRLDALRQDDSFMADIQRALDEEQAKRQAQIVERQKGQGLESVFTEEEINRFSNTAASDKAEKIHDFSKVFDAKVSRED